MRTSGESLKANELKPQHCAKGNRSIHRMKSALTSERLYPSYVRIL